MLINEHKEDAEPFTPKGKPIPFDDLYLMSLITPDDIAAGAAFFMESVPPRFRRLLG